MIHIINIIKYILRNIKYMQIPSIQDPQLATIYSAVQQNRFDLQQHQAEEIEVMKDLMKYLKETPTSRPDRHEIVNAFVNRYILPPSLNGYLRMYILLNQQFTFNVDVPGLPIFTWTVPQGLTHFVFPEGTKLQVVTPAPQTSGAAVPIRFVYTDGFYIDTSTIVFLLNSIVTSSSSDYPQGAIPLTATSGNVANAIANAFLPGTVGRTTYITGFDVSSDGATTGAIVTISVSPTVSGSMQYIYNAVAGATTADLTLVVNFSKPVPSNAQNTGINVQLPALGAGNTNAIVNARGYQL